MLLATSANAQHPVCAPIADGETIQAICAPLSYISAVRFATDFAVDHHFKPAPPLIQRTALEISQLILGKQLTQNSALAAFLRSLEPMRFVQLDASTGTVIADFSGGERQFESRLAGFAGDPTLALRLPSSLQGGYWRAPDALQIAFWKDHRIAIRIEHGAGHVIDSEIECVSLSPDGLIIRFVSPDAPPLLASFRECER